jgi:hypothetical protein
MTVLPTTSGWPYTAPSSRAVHRWLSRPAAGSPAAAPVRPAVWPYSGQADAGPGAPAAVLSGELPACAEFAGAEALCALLAAMPPLVQAATTQAAAAQAVPRTPPITTFRMRLVSLGELAKWTHYG